MRWDIVALGEPLYELNQQPDGRFVPGFGGDTSNVLVAAARLGARTAYVSRLGTDLFGGALRELWRREQVDDAAVIADPQAPTGRYFVTHGPEGHAFTYKREGSAASRLSPADVPEELIAAAAFLHVSGISQAISASAAAAVDRAAGIARAKGVRLSYDTNFRPRLWSAAEARPAVERLARQADIVKISLDEAQALTGLSTPEAVAHHVLALGAKQVFVTLGRDGILLAGPAGVTHIPAFNVAAVDATGAGDAFTGALLTEFAHGRELREAAHFAAAAAALSTTGYGAIAPLPTRAAVEDFLRHR
jgi:2-dehydro-3-deoxygluconokinase